LKTQPLSADGKRFEKDAFRNDTPLPEFDSNTNPNILENATFAMIGDCDCVFVDGKRLTRFQNKLDLRFQIPPAA